MREEEKALRQKLGEMERTKKQLQCDLTNRDRTIQQLRVVGSVRSGCVSGYALSSSSHFLHLPQEQSDRKPEQTLQLYQKTCKGNVSVSVCFTFLLIKQYFKSSVV